MATVTHINTKSLVVTHVPYGVSCHRVLGVVQENLLDSSHFSFNLKPI